MSTETLSDIMMAMQLTPAEFRTRLKERGLDIQPRTFRRYLAPPDAASFRKTPDNIMALAREIAGRGHASEWAVGTDDFGRRIVVHCIEPRFAAVMKGRDTVAAIDWWSPKANEASWQDAARRASERFYHREYKDRRTQKNPASHKAGRQVSPEEQNPTV